MSKIATNEVNLKFIKAEATNTRLMGVVGLVAYFENENHETIVQIYHLDFESFGIDGFHYLVNPEEDEFETLVLGVAGGLGGDFLEISYEAFVFLIKSAYAVDETCIDSLVDFECFEAQFSDMFADLSLVEEAALYMYLCPQISTPEMLINYFLMRIVGCDYKATLGLYKAGDFDPSFELVETAQTFIKNTIHLKKKTREKAIYQCESIVDLEAQYALVITEIQVSLKELKITKVKELERLSMSSIEAAFNLNLPEYMIVCGVEDAFFERRFAIQNPEMMKQNYPFGNLYIEFNRDNTHVSNNPYRLSGDVYLMYYFTVSGQLIICGLNKENILSLDAFFYENGVYEDSLSRICEVRLDDPMLLTFVNSGYDNLFDFLSAQ